MGVIASRGQKEMSRQHWEVTVWTTLRCLPKVICYVSDKEDMKRNFVTLSEGELTTRSHGVACDKVVSIRESAFACCQHPARQSVRNVSRIAPRSTRSTQIVVLRDAP